MTLSGEIPPDLGKLSKLQALWLNGNGLSNNSLSGGNLTNLIRLQLGKRVDR